MGDLLEPGNAPHYCDRPSLDIRIRNGAVWKCECGLKWKLHTWQTNNHSYVGEWECIGVDSFFSKIFKKGKTSNA